MSKANEIMKPMSVLRAEFINSLTDLINNSKLPPFVVEAVLKDMYTDIKIVSQRQLESDYKKYQEMIECDDTKQK